MKLFCFAASLESHISAHVFGVLYAKRMKYVKQTFDMNRHTSVQIADWAVVGVAGESLKLFFCENKNKNQQKSRDLNSSTSIDDQASQLYKWSNIQTTRKYARNHADIETRRKSSHRTYHSCTKPPKNKIVHSRTVVVCVAVVRVENVTNHRSHEILFTVTLSSRTGFINKFELPKFFKILTTSNCLFVNSFTLKFLKLSATLSWKFLKISIILGRKFSKISNIL